MTFSDLKRWRDQILQMQYYYETIVNERRCIVVHAGYVEKLVQIKDQYQDLETFYLYAREDAYTLGRVEHGMIVAGHIPMMIEGQFVYNEGQIFRYYDPEKDCIYYDIGTPIYICKKDIYTILTKHI